MTLKSMYPAAVNSPGTELAADITATATEITVLSTNELPDAPNLLTLGSDETAETVRYTKIDGTRLTVERGFQGAAKSWSAGTRIARYFTAYDHDTFRENIEAIDAETSDAEHVDLTLSPGLQIVESAQDTPFQFDGVRGCTRINLNGFDGNFDRRTSPLFTFFGTSEIVPSNGPVGTKVQKIVCNRTDTAHFGARYELNIDRSKHYVAVAYMENVNCEVPVYFSIAEFKDTGYISIRKSASLDKGSGMQYLYTTVTPAQMENREKLIYYFRGEGTSGAEFRIGAFAFYEVTQAEYDAIAKMTPEQVAERYPYVDSMTNVKNPYAIVTGGNLLPPFTDWNINLSGIAKVIDLYEVVAEITSEGTKAPLSTVIPVLPDTTYTISSEGNAIPGNGLQIIERKDGKDGDASGEISGGYFDNVPGKVAVGSVTFTTTAQTHYLSLRLRFDKAGTYTINKPMILPTTEPKPFTPQQRSMLAFETELAAHPVDGSNPDTLFMGDDGLPYVLEKWGKFVITYEFVFGYNNKGDGFKRVEIIGKFPNAQLAYMQKFDGMLLTEGNWTAGADRFNIETNRPYVTIANTDSGWGPDYNPSNDEIKAYFLGWRMCNRLVGINEPYNATGEKGWVRIGDTGNISSTIPTVMNDGRGGWQPYRLQYLKAKPTVEPVRNYELGATLTAGSNMVEVSSGIVIRESVSPWNKDGNFYINASGSPLKYRCASIADVFRHHTKDYKWALRQRPSTDSDIALGTGFASITNASDFDPTAVYHVTYTMLDPTLPAPISGTVAANLRGTVSDLVQDVGDIGRRLSVVETQKAEKDAAPPQWIKATLLNGWNHYDSGSDLPVRYRKVGNYVEINGLAKGGTTTNLTDIFILPVEYRPRSHQNLVLWSSAGNTELAVTRIFVSASTGAVRIASNDAKNTWLSFSNAFYPLD